MNRTRTRTRTGTRRPTRDRAFGVSGAIAAAALVLAGCSAATPGESEQEAQASGLLPPAEGQTQYPLTLESYYGTMELPERPNRVAAVLPNGTDTELLLAIGVTPVLSASKLEEASAYLDAYGAADIEVFEYVGGDPLPFEEIALSDPDLIVAVGWDDFTGGGARLDDNYERLASIAPVLTSPEEGSVVSPWEESIRSLGEALDLSSAAEEVVAENETYFAGVRAENPEFSDLTVTWAVWYGSDYGPLAYGSAPGTATANFLGELGFEPNPLAEGFVESTSVSDESLGQVDADVLIIGQNSDDADFATLTDRELFQNLTAVKSERFISFKKEDTAGFLAWAVGKGGPIAQRWAAELLVPMIKDVL